MIKGILRAFEMKCPQNSLTPNIPLLSCFIASHQPIWSSLHLRGQQNPASDCSLSASDRLL